MATPTWSSGQKIWISRAEHSDLMVLLVRTTPRDEAAKPSDGMSVLLVDLREAVGTSGLTIRPVRTMLNHATTELFFDDLAVPAENLVGEEGKGFRYILDGMNAERILIASECIGDAKFFIDRASAYAKERNVFGRADRREPGGAVPHRPSPGADERRRADGRQACRGACSTPASPAAPRPIWPRCWRPKPAWFAADTCLQVHGGFGFAEEYDIERKFRETRLYQVAPISTNLILSHVGTHVLGMPKSF